MLSDTSGISLPRPFLCVALVFGIAACDPQADETADASTMSSNGAGATSGGIAGAGATMAGVTPAGMGSSAGGSAGAGGVAGAAIGGTSGDAGAPFGAPGGPSGIGGGTGAPGGTGSSGGSTAGSRGDAGASGGTGALDGGATADAGNDAAPGACPHAQLRGADFCTIGDSWIQIPGNQVTTLENHLKKAGVIPQADRFDRREVSGSTLSAIIGTYDRKPQNCKILIMDGGGIDLFVAPAGDQAAVAPVLQMFKDFLRKLKSDGYVQHIIYSLYPVIPSTPNLNVNMRPGFSEACAASAVDCHLVDLEPLFKGQHIGWDQTHADDAGGVIIGDAWWKAMQENCIAQ